MFAIAIFIELYSYVIFALGLSKLLTQEIVFAASLVVCLVGLWYAKKYGGIKTILKQTKEECKSMIKSRFCILVFTLFFISAAVNLIGALGPEIAFDALWYHLTLPRLFIEEQSIRFFQGGLLYYSPMPKMIDILYIPALMYGNEIAAKLIHFSFGVFTTICIYIFAKRYTTTKWAAVASLVFYTNLVVAWQSTTAYIDLGRTLFEFLALVGFINYQKTKSKKWLLEAGVMMGAALSTKWIAAGSLVIFAVLFATLNLTWREKIKEFTLFTLIALFVIIPIAVFSFDQTGNPFYPLFSPFYEVTTDISHLLHPKNIFQDTLSILLFAPDPVSTIYLLTLPFLWTVWKKLGKGQKSVALYSAVAFLVWYLTPRTGGGRFILPYLPAFSLLVVFILEKTQKNIQKVSLTCIIIIACITIGYRAIANWRYIPVVTGTVTKNEFLTSNLNYTFGDFYDTDGYISERITQNDRVLVYGLHNLYYLEVPFIHESYIKKGDQFNYILLGPEATLPQRFAAWDKIYSNPKTGVELYTAYTQWKY